MRNKSIRNAACDCLLLLVFTSALIRPLFRLEYLNNWSSIESTFIADARMLSDHLPHPAWQPLWYGGTRFDYIYPPALRYGTALLSKFGGVSTARAYHVFIAVFYVFGIVAVYWLVRAGSGSRKAALLASFATALLSPSFLLLPAIRNDSPYLVPQRLHVLMTYGEGPHISALSVLPAALALSFLALRNRNLLALAGASVLCALTVALNFYGATALAIFFPLAAWSVWVSQRDRFVWMRAAVIAALAYALCAFWLTPSYLKITAANLRLVATPGNNGSRLVALFAIAVFCIATWKRRERAWTVFVAGAGLFLSLYVLGYFYAGFRVAGDAARLIPELDLALILVFVEAVHALWKRPKLRAIAVVAVVAAFVPSIKYLRHTRFPFPKAGPLQTQYEYSTSKWVHDHLPGERVLPSGSVRFWFDAWFDNSQMDGGSAQGMLNRTLPDASWQISNGDPGEIAIAWLQALGTDAVIVPDRTSPDPYHDYQKPEKFRELIPALYDDQHGTVIYRIPRRYPGIGRVVDTVKIASIGRVKAGDDLETLSRYVAVVEQTPASVSWASFEEFSVQARTSMGQSVLVQETYDPAWHAYEDGKPRVIRIDPVMDFILIDVPPGEHQIQFRFETPLENRIGQGISILGLVLVLSGCVLHFFFSASVRPGE